MSFEKWQSLVEQLGERFSFLPTEQDYQSFDIFIDNVNFEFIYGGPVDEDSLYVNCEYGSLPEMYDAEIIELLLETNLVNFGNHGPVYAIDRLTKSVIQMFRFSVSDTPIDKIHTIMTQAAFQANIWRYTYFLPLQKAENIEEKLKEEMQNN